MPVPCVNPADPEIYIAGGPYTRKQMRSSLRLRLQEFSASDGARSPQLLNTHIMNAADQMARQCWAFFERRWLDIVEIPGSDPATPAWEYNVFDCFDAKSVQVRWADGSIKLLSPSTPQIMDSIWGPYWRDPSTAQQGNPITIVWEGLNRFQLYPRPNYVTECHSGIGIEGYFSCGAWDKSLLPSDPLQDLAYCPLPAHVHDGVILLACINRVGELMNPDAERRLAFLEKMYKPYRAALARMGFNRYGNTAPDSAINWNNYYGGGVWLSSGGSF